MRIKRSLIWFLLVFIVGCTDKHPSVIPSLTKRDTTIVAANAYTNLLLDSPAVQNFVDSMVRDSALAAGIISFYNSRNYQYAWFDEKGLTEPAGAFWTIHRTATRTIDNIVARDSLFHADMDSLVDGDSMSLSATARQCIELSLTAHFFRYMSPTLAQQIKPADVKWYIPARKIDVAAALDSLLRGNNPNWHPLGQRFYQLRARLAAYSKIQQAGGWPEIRINAKTLRPGMHSPEVESIRKRLRDIPGNAAVPGDTTLFDTALEQKVKSMQRCYGLPVTGVIDRPLIDELNIPVSDRIRQILINLQRLKWIPVEDSSYILVNIPEYRLKVYENDSVALAMRIVVGKAAHHTVIFSGDLKYIVFSPYWNVPASIVRNEIVPAMKKDHRYLVRHRMEVTGHAGGLPVIRQKPGSGNALGKVKFLFPNQYNIYLHDTPQRDLFQKDRRAFSHGCIRLEHPFELARLLLANEPDWNDKKIRTAMNGSREKWATLRQPMPIFIVYLTSWVDSEGLLHFAKDIYGHDREMASHLFAD